MARIILLTCFLGGSLWAQKYPLESLTITGTAVPERTVLEMTALAKGMPIDKEALDQACAKLSESGMFSDAQYQYKPGPKRGFAVTLTLADQPVLMPATIDVPEVQEADAWKWLTVRFPALDHRVPGAGSAQEYVAHELESHLAPQLQGHHMVAQMETDLGGGGSIVSFHPDVLPQISVLQFSGEREVPEAELREMLRHVVGTDGYMERRFRSAVDLNLRGLYEQHGMYRVKFTGVKMERVGTDAVSVTTAIEEGPQYKLGAVQFSGDGVPAEDMERAGKFRVGEVANWREIDRGIQEAQRGVQAQGYLDIAAKPERVFDNERRVLSVRVPVDRGPLYHLGQVRFSGLTPEQEALAHRAWTAQTGAAFEARYEREFYQAFAKVVDVKQFKKVNLNVRKTPGHMVDVEVVFSGVRGDDAQQANLTS